MEWSWYFGCFSQALLVGRPRSATPGSVQVGSVAATVDRVETRQCRQGQPESVTDDGCTCYDAAGCKTERKRASLGHRAALDAQNRSVSLESGLTTWFQSACELQPISMMANSFPASVSVQALL